MTETESQLCQLLRKSLDKELTDLEADTDLVDDLALESIQVMDFIADVEDHFDILIEVDRLASIRTLGELAGLVEEEVG
ncbi:MAG: acyl carrier protein [Pseudomonadales bacterium]|jgi:acyl carrier protein